MINWDEIGTLRYSGDSVDSKRCYEATLVSLKHWMEQLINYPFSSKGIESHNLKALSYLPSNVAGKFYYVVFRITIIAFCKSSKILH